jgi:hypothetical protein
LSNITHGQEDRRRESHDNAKNDQHALHLISPRDNSSGAPVSRTQAAC